VASANLVPQQRIDDLTRIYRLYRTHLHHRSLDGKGAVLPGTDFESERATIVAIWDSVMGG
jgi:glutamine synthetase adenylyltransferase